MCTTNPSQRKVYNMCSIVHIIRLVLYSIQLTHLERPFGCQSNSFNGKPGLLALWRLDRPERETGLHAVHHLLYRGKGPLLYLKAKKYILSLIRLKLLFSKIPQSHSSLTFDSLGWSVSVSGSTVRTLWSDPHSLHLNSTGTLLRFFTRRVLSEQEPMAVG